MQSLGGILVAFVLKFTDSVIKAYATSISILLSGLFSIVFLDDGISPDSNLIIGGLLVMVSVYLYNRSDYVVENKIKKN